MIFVILNYLLEGGLQINSIEWLAADPFETRTGPCGRCSSEPRCARSTCVRDRGVAAVRLLRKRSKLTGGELAWRCCAPPAVASHCREPASPAGQWAGRCVRAVQSFAGAVQGDAAGCCTRRTALKERRRLFESRRPWHFAGRHPHLPCCSSAGRYSTTPRACSGFAVGVPCVPPQPPPPPLPGRAERLVQL